MSSYPCPQYPQPLVTIETLQVLIENISSGERRVKYADKEVEYHSFADMRKIYDWMYLMLYPCAGGGRIQKVSAEYDSGLNSPLDYPETSEIGFRRHW